MSHERRIDIRTLIIASLASAAAALITSQFWIRGTPIAAAVTPVLVTILSEALRHPTEKIADRFTAETDALPEAAGADPPPPSEETEPLPALSDNVRVYRQARRRLPWGPIAATAAAAFAIGAAIITVPELVTGSSLGGGNDHTSYFGGTKHKSGNAQTTETQTETVTQEEQAPPDNTQTTPTTPTTTSPRTTPTTPAPGATPAPQQQQTQTQPAK
jgi:hypothetical protein